MPKNNSSMENLLDVLKNHGNISDTMLEKIRSKQYNLETHDAGNNTALILAAQHGNTACVKALIDAGANIHSTNRREKTALILASYNGHLECVTALLTAGAHVNHPSMKGQTALMLASFRGHKKCVNALIDAKADVNQSGHRGFTSLHLASFWNRHDCQMTLLMTGARSGQHRNDNARALFKLIKSYDMRDTRVPLALATLCDHQKQLDPLHRTSRDLDNLQLHLAETYLYKLQEAHQLHKKNVWDALDLGTSFAKELPEILIDLIAQYDVSYKTPLEDDRIEFKHFFNIGKLLKKEVVMSSELTHAMRKPHFKELKVTKPLFGSHHLNSEIVKKRILISNNQLGEPSQKTRKLG